MSIVQPAQRSEDSLLTSDWRAESPDSEFKAQGSKTLDPISVGRQ